MSGELATFEDALRSIPKNEGKHILLGNGFSQACRSDIFSYGSLLEKADFSKLSKRARDSFNTLETTDFEVVIRTLRDSAKLVEIYANDQKKLVSTLNGDAKKLKNLLVDTISKHHPANPSKLSDSEFRHGREFLRNFKNIYTLNYDLLLYWTLMHELEGDKPFQKIDFDDGFRHPDGEDESVTYVSWEVENSNKQNVYYLHGALHLFESDTELQKFTWTRTGVKLIDQINESLERDSYPLIVAEGTSDQKMGRIMKSGYLQRGLKSLASIGGSLFVYGMSMSPNDEHILKRIEKSKISNLWVGVYGDPKAKSNKEMIARASALESKNGKKSPLSVKFYDAQSATVWAG
ncbi:DUF4917 family protein [Bdellovibrio sp. HCB290]|uniref:DUF4917 family protein n=1 Tax=Bdellovibrio sp. HCB290 TaxID=3394356 RepID=UPI0039B372C0